MNDLFFLLQIKVLDEQDQCALWSGFDPNLPLERSSTSWKVPRAIDPLPSLEEYQKWQEDQKRLQQYQKENHNNEPLPSDLQKIYSQKNITNYPRKLIQLSFIDRLLSDRSGDYGDCPYESTICEILLYWCYNNKPFTDQVLTLCFDKYVENLPMVVMILCLGYGSWKKYYNKKTPILIVLVNNGLVICPNY